MHLTIKLPNNNLDLELEEDSLVEKLRLTCSQKLSITPGELCLIFKGKILKDNEKLIEIGIVEGCCIHGAFRALQNTNIAPPKPATQAQVQAPVSQNSIPTSSVQINSPEGINSLANSDSMRRLLENPEIIKLMTTPGMIENLTQMDPNMKRILDLYPELAASLRDPQTIQQILDLMKNPQAFQENLRNQDRILTQIQNVPGAMSEYMRMFYEMQTIVQGSQSTNTPSQTSTSQAQFSSRSDSSTANVSGEAMPNPWVPTTTSNTTQSTTSTSDSTPASQKNFNSDKSALLRDVSSALKLFHNPDNQISIPLLEKIRQSINSLSPRGQYGLTEYAKGLEVLKEESPELIAHMLNYQISLIRSDISNMEERVIAGDTANNYIPPENGNEQTYKSQLGELENMGFNNKDENIAALRFAYGDIGRAVEWILHRRGV